MTLRRRVQDLLLGGIGLCKLGIFDEVQGVLVEQVQGHDVSATALEIHATVLHGGVMAASIGILDDELELGQPCRHALLTVADCLGLGAEALLHL